MVGWGDTLRNVGEKGGGPSVGVIFPKKTQGKTQAEMWKNGKGKTQGEFPKNGKGKTQGGFPKNGKGKWTGIRLFVFEAWDFGL